MQWRRDSESGCLPVAVFFLWLYSAALVKSAFFREWPFLAFLIVYIFAGFISYYILAVSIGGVIDLYSRVKLAQTVCKHSVRGGETLDKCDHCMADKQAFENQLKIEA